ncbi:MAG: autotransporter outer membrane beta-barrel domain-containing protein [Deltaproteobacteria bacterium]|nr:autotransporter outer membrane beta-barrel domain-containing protein [Deltaproteobacteria bacterium]
MTDWAEVQGGIMGGVAVPTGGTGVASYNRIVINHSINTSAAIPAVYGGVIMSDGVNGGSGTASYNSIIINNNVEVKINFLDGAHVDGPASVLGDDSSKLEYNSVEVRGDTGTVTVLSDVFGAYLASGKKPTNGDGPILQQNTVILERGTVGNGVSDGSVYGAYVGEGIGVTIKGNTVTISGDDVDVTHSVIGGGVRYKNTNAGIVDVAEENKVFMSAGTVGQDVVGGNVSGGTAKANKVYLSGGEVGGNVAGGYAGGTSASDPGSAVNNFVYVTETAEIGGWVAGGRSRQDNAEGNEVLIEALVTAVVGDIYGGNVNSDSGDTASANSNKVTIKGSALSSAVYGGFVLNGTGTAKNNRVTLSGDINLGAGVDMFGGYSGGSGDAFHGNELALNSVNYTGNKRFGGIQGFENLTLEVTSAQAVAAQAAGTALLQVTDLSLKDPNSTDGSTMRVNFTGTDVIPLGTDFILVDSTNPIVTNGDPVKTTVGTLGLLDVTLGLDYTANTRQVQATVENIGPNVQAKALSELPLADVSFVNRGSDMIAGQAIPTALASVSGTVGVAAFAAVGYGWERTETGSHIDVKGVSGDIGLAVGTDTSAGPFVAGAFLEFGDGSFDSYNEFAGISSVHGEGDLSYLGGGVFARLDIGQPDASRPYFEASVRFGKTDADFSTRDFRGHIGEKVSYDFDAKYWGFHAGGGYIINFDSFDGSLDLSAKYFHTHRDGDDFILFGQRVSLSSVTSSRVRAGGRLNAAITSTIKSYFGLYFEHEFDGDSRATYAGYALPEASLGGSSGVGELGLIVSSPSSPLEVQMGVEGSAGRRDSFSANLSLRVTF